VPAILAFDLKIRMWQSYEGAHMSGSKAMSVALGRLNLIHKDDVAIVERGHEGLYLKLAYPFVYAG